MEEEHRALEDALAALSPAPVPVELEARVLQIFDGVAETGVAPDNVVPFPLWRRVGAAAAVLVAGVGVFFGVLNNLDLNTSEAPLAKGAAPETPTGGTFLPVRADNVFEGIRDGEVFLGKDGGPVRELHYKFSDSFRWENPEDGSVIEMTVPRERHFLVPVRTD